MKRVCVFLMILGCSPKPQDARVLRIFPRPPSPVRVYYKDQLAGEIGWRTRWLDEGSVQIPGPFAAGDREIRIEHLRLEMLTPDGWVATDPPTSPRFKPYDKQPHVGISIEDRGLYSILLIDNRNHDAVRVGCGKMTIDVPKDAKLRLLFPIARNETNTRVTLNDAEIGAIAAGYADTALVDVTGERKYFFYFAKYAPFGLGNAPSTDESYRAKTFHKICSSVDLFLETPPQKVDSPRTLGVLVEE